MLRYACKRAGEWLFNGYAELFSYFSSAYMDRMDSSKHQVNIGSDYNTGNASHKTAQARHL
jgi:hypothetical protein